MKKSLVLAVLAMAFGVSFTYASSLRTVTVNVPFQFTAGDKQLAAGSYKIERDEANPTVLRIQGQGPKGTNLVVPVVTRLAGNPKQTSASFVFDKVAGQNYLSEVWLPGQDGFLVKATAQAHQHAVVKTE